MGLHLGLRRDILRFHRGIWVHLQIMTQPVGVAQFVAAAYTRSGVLSALLSVFQ